MKYLFITLSLLPSLLFSQVKFIEKGKIEYEKQVNLHKQMEANWSDGDANEGENTWLESMKKNTPKVVNSYYNLLFTTDKTLYVPGREVVQNNLTNMPDWLKDRTNENIIFNNLTSHTTIAQKAVFENTFLLQDSLQKINWRITNDSRNIAGFECRKAVGKIFDSVYVIAFYTDQILPSSGPCSFNGLPGMILGIAVPKINTTWFATKVELIEIKETELVAPTKGKKYTYDAMMQQLKKSTKDWGKYGQRNIWQIMM